MPDRHGRRQDQRRRPAGGAADSPSRESGGLLDIHEALVGCTLEEAREWLARAGIDPAAQGRAARERAEAAWAALASSRASSDLETSGPPSARLEADDFGALWAPLSGAAPPWLALDARRAQSGLAWVQVSGPRVADFGWEAGDLAAIDASRQPEPGDAVAIWTGDGRRAIVRLRGRGSDLRLDAPPLGPDDVDDLSATRVVGTFVTSGRR